MEKPQDVTVTEGESARFTCRLLGMPRPQVQWFHMGKPIVDDEVYNIDADEDGNHSLYLPECFPEDAGVYTVRATNEHGVAEACAILTVEGECMIPQ